MQRVTGAAHHRPMTNGEIGSPYERDGYVVIPEVIDRELVAEVQGHVEWLERRHPDLRPEQFHHHLIVDDPFWIRLCTDPRLIDVIEPFLGPDIALFGAHYISKPPAQRAAGALAPGRQLLAAGADGGDHHLAGGGRLDARERLHARDSGLAPDQTAARAPAYRGCARTS